MIVADASCPDTRRLSPQKNQSYRSLFQLLAASPIQVHECLRREPVFGRYRSLFQLLAASPIQVHECLRREPVFGRERRGKEWPGKRLAFMLQQSTY
ncbi:hypothetical protein F2P81_003294 [Scophthalmus maximus]|uniref:Uncharacterized protein n=1 Tax=Scophthalmus maximus TaxID=52904 RepID=A0A6A4T990_SCOMX|nr:hypothetical protein F2P81_003294 [Scophthalmus maximus]